MSRPFDPWPPPDPARHAAERRRSFWRVLGISLAVVLVVTGLALVALVVWFWVALSNMGSNK